MKKVFVGLLIILMVFSVIGCGGTIQPSATDQLQQQTAEKADQAAKLASSVKSPKLNYSIERENIAKRLEATNNPNQLGWVYLFETGRAIGRFPVRGKVTSGSKRLSSTEMKIDIDTGEWSGETLAEAPDDMGAYGSSDPYIFWFDPAGNYHQFNGNYFYSTKPYQIEMGAITLEVDQTELKKYGGK